MRRMPRDRERSARHERRAPVARIVWRPASNFEIIDTWHSTGLAGSGSNDYRDEGSVRARRAHDRADDAAATQRRSTATSACSWPAGTGSRSDSRAGRLMRRSRSRRRRCTSFLPRRCLLRQRPHARVALAKAEMDMARRARLHLRDGGPHLGRSAVAGPRVARHAPRDGAVVVSTRSAPPARSRSRCTTWSARRPCSQPRRHSIACCAMPSR